MNKDDQKLNETIYLSDDDESKELNTPEVRNDDSYSTRESNEINKNNKNRLVLEEKLRELVIAYKAAVEALEVFKMKN